ncbi:MAG: BF3164 family lipoprotein [Mangrovibacterium sp.]
MKMRYLWIIIFLFVLMSCNKQEYKDTMKFYFPDFFETVYLKGEELKFDKELLRPVRLYLIDSVLVMQNHHVETHFHKYNIHTKKKIGECIHWGSGPEEMLYPKVFQQADSILWIYDKNRRRMMSYSKEHFLYSNNPMSLSIINFNETFDKAAVSANGQIVSIVLSPESQRISFYNKEGTRVKTSGEFPECGLTLTPVETIESFLCNISIHPQDGRICLSYNRTDLLEFYDSDGILKKRIHGPDHFFPVIAQGKKGEGIGVYSIEGKTRDGYFSPVAFDNSLFLLYSGKFFDRNDTMYLVNQIFVFDWDGNPIKRFILDIPIFWFTVDEKQKKIYGLTDVPDFRVIAFQF